MPNAIRICLPKNGTIEDSDIAWMKAYRRWGPRFETGVSYIDPMTGKKMSWSQREGFASKRVIAFLTKQAQVRLSRYTTSIEDDTGLLRNESEGILKYVCTNPHS
eukprot:gb/GECG01000116.1/.p1 GENE.gb/GECG01000116.1/~~gb/GECG01000116.1/.p1  ORF type:complete len:105 (+),score=8.46 gb/GECG01000116.1/:1-315(+)